MSTRGLAPELEVASRFDRAQARFKATVPIDDYRLMAVLDALGSVHDQTVLDLGCGKGRFARELSERGAEVIGVDVSRGMLEQSAGFGVIQASARRLPLACSAFDAVLLIETLQHISRVRDVFAEALRVLKPGGQLIVIDKNKHALNARRPWLPNVCVKWLDEHRGRGMYPAGSPVRERWFAPGNLASEIRAAGLIEVESRGLLAPDEVARPVFRLLSGTRAMYFWKGRKPGRGE